MFSKTSRQLIIFHIFICSKVVELKEISNIINVSIKTIIRDINELKTSGVINIKYSKKENGYVHIEEEYVPNPIANFSDNSARNRHLEKLIRLGAIMRELKYHRELPYYNERAKNQETCSEWYKKKFPSLSTRTMWRDFQELNNIGYFIEYNKEDKCYSVDFPEDIEGLQSRIEIDL